MRPSATYGDTVVKALTADATVRSCSNLRELLGLISARFSHVLLLLGPLDALINVVKPLRVAAPTAFLTLLTENGSPHSRAHAMDLGADICLPFNIDPQEIAAMVRAACRRQLGSLSVPAQPTMPGSPPAWRLEANGRTLVGPQNQRLPLTGSEWEFFVRILSMPGYRLTRQRIAADREAIGQGKQAPRSVDVLVSRLRSKASRMGIDLPLLAVRSWGYMFVPEGVWTS
jgi:DNA-binding response OmpR family regulator